MILARYINLSFLKCVSNIFRKSHLCPVTEIINEFIVLLPENAMAVFQKPQQVKTEQFE